MPDGQDRVDSPNVAVRAAIGRIVDLLVDNGGTLHPALVIVERAGAISIHADVDHGALLAEVPEELLVPVSDCRIEAVSDLLKVVDRSTSLSGVQSEMLEAHLDVYNLTGKTVWARTMLAQFALADHPSDTAVVRRLRPSFAAETVSLADAFIQTRVLRTMRTPSDDTDTSKVRVLMPVIDFFNHHHRGMGYDGRDGWLRIRAARPAGGTECFARYRRLDALGQILHYGFVLDETRLASSAPVQVTVDGLNVSVLSRQVAAQSVLDPPAVQFDGSTLTLSHLTFDLERPRRLVGALSLAVRMAVRRSTGTDPGEGDLTTRLIEELACADAEVVASVRRDIQFGGPLRVHFDRALDIHSSVIAQTTAAIVG